MKIRTAIFASLMASVLLAGCQGSVFDDVALKAEKPLPRKIVNQMKAKGMTRTSPIMVRIFKEEGVLEVWKQKDNGRYDIISSYEICKWSGKLGPKFVEGDRQAPEGFYTVYPAQMNPNSQYYLAFNMGFPNAYDRAHGRTGQHLMVHGACSSAGCYSMTDEQVSEIYAFGRDAFLGGQRAFQIQAFPFRMTAANMARYRNDSNYEFWKMLKQGYDAFEINKVPPKVDVCEKRYVFNNMAIPSGSPATAACPPTIQSETISTAFTNYHKSYEAAFNAAAAKNGKPTSPSIAGLAEAKLVSAWSAARARGERVSREPPSLNYSVPAPPPAAHPAPIPANTPTNASTNAPANAPASTSTPAATTVPVPSANPAAAPIGDENNIMVQKATDPSPTDTTVTGAVAEKKSLWNIFKK